MRAGRIHVGHFPRARFVTISTGGKSTDGADIDEHPALFTFKVIFFVRSDDGDDAAILNTQRPYIHGLATNANAAVAQDAAGAIEVNHRRPLLLVTVVLGFHVLGLGSAVGERHVLQFAFAASVADGAVKRVITQKQFNHALASLMDFRRIGAYRHAFADNRGAGSLQLGHFFDLDQAHAASALQRKIRVVAE